MALLKDYDPRIVYHSPPNQLSVSDIERLAKAGVTMKFEEIQHIVVPDSVAFPPAQPYQLADPLYDRLRRVDRTRNRDAFGVSIHLTAVEHGEDVYVFVATGRGEPVILKDKSFMYPSDALMAQIHLLEEAQK